MRVADLIRRLEELPQDLPVVIPRDSELYCVEALTDISVERWDKYGRIILFPENPSYKDHGNMVAWLT